MKLLWLCNTAPGVVSSHLTGKERGAVNWVDHVLSDLRRRGVTIRILCPGNGGSGALDEHCSYATFPTGLPYAYRPQVEEQFRQELRTYRPDVIHSWGTEYAHTLAMVNAAEQEGVLRHMAASIQGLCSVHTGHYAEGVPAAVQRRYTFRDLVRRDNILSQQKKFALRGELEAEALKKLRHVIGRTDWDRICTRQLSPESAYHFCNETLRENFYEGQWRYEACRKHRIFASSCVYPIKGFHYLLEALAEVVKVYPDATLAVTGESFLEKSPLRRSAYDNYMAGLVKKHHLEGKVEFLGKLSAEGMKQAFLEANVFALPSTIENSPNSLGEAMLLSVPCVASDVGGVTNLLTHRKEGFVYQSTAPYMLAGYLCEVFAMEDRAETLGAAAHAHASQTHNPQVNLDRLLQIYEALA